MLYIFDDSSIEELKKQLAKKDDPIRYDLGDGFTFFKYGKIGLIYVSRVSNLESSGNFTYLAQLPEDCRPIQPFYLPLHGSANGSLIPINGYIGTDRRIGLNQSSGLVCTHQRGTATFILA